MDANFSEEPSSDLSGELRARAESLLETKRAEAEAIANDRDALSTALDSVKNWMERFATKLSLNSIESLTTIFRLLKATWRGEYQGLDKSAIATLVAAALYCVSPADVIPDVVPGLGLLDDAFVLAWTIKSLSTELQSFRTWERLGAAKSALASYLPKFREIKRVTLCQGWLTESESCDEIVETLAPVFPNAQFESFRWHSNIPWDEARDFADGPGADEFGEFLTDSSVDLANTAIFGHSLGARITVRALAKLTREPEKKTLWSRKTTNRVAQTFLMGAAINADDPDIALACTCSLTPVCNFFSRIDRALGYFYRLAERRAPLGLTGLEISCDNYVDCMVSGHEEFFLDVASNMSDLVTFLHPKSVASKISAVDALSHGFSDYLKHQFALYATFFRDSIAANSGAIN